MGDDFDPSGELVRVSRGKDESTFSVVPIFFTIVPSHRLVPILVTLAELLLDNCYSKGHTHGLQSSQCVDLHLLYSLANVFFDFEPVLSKSLTAIA